MNSMPRVNQRNGFDCPGCARPESITGKKSAAEPRGNPATVS
ncbi:hypothetical protein [Pseudarthrobacter sp. H2]